MRKYLTFKNLLMIGMVIVLLYLLTCKKPLPVPIVVTSVDSIKERIIHDTIVSRQYQDSVIAIIESKDKEIASLYYTRNVLQHQVNSLEQGFTDYIATPLPDTCKKYQAWVISEYNKISEASKKKDAVNEKIIASKNVIINQKDLLIANGKKDYKNLRANTDTCLKNQTTLEKYVKALKPKREVYIGAIGMGNQSLSGFGFGINLGLRTRKGMMYEVGVVQIANTTQYTVGVKKSIFRF